MNINEAIKKCCEEGGFKNCEECGVYENGCWEYLSKYMLDECKCHKKKYYTVVNGEIEKVDVKFCPECGGYL